jgi:hypothetical protein
MIQKMENDEELSGHMQIRSRTQKNSVGNRSQFLRSRASMAYGQNRAEKYAFVHQI